MDNNNQILNEEPYIECFRLQPKITIPPKQYISCPNCQSRIELAKSIEVLEDSEKENLVAYSYRCPGCSKKWFYDLFFRPIFI